MTINVRFALMVSEFFYLAIQLKVATEKPILQDSVYCLVSALPEIAVVFAPAHINKAFPANISIP